MWLLISGQVSWVIGEFCMFVVVVNICLGIPLMTLLLLFDLKGKSKRRQADGPVHDTEQAEPQRAEWWGHCRYPVYSSIAGHIMLNLWTLAGILSLGIKVLALMLIVILVWMEIWVIDWYVIQQWIKCVIFNLYSRCQIPRQPYYRACCLQRWKTILSKRVLRVTLFWLVCALRWPGLLWQLSTQASQWIIQKCKLKLHCKESSP